MNHKNQKINPMRVVPHRDEMRTQVTEKSETSLFSSFRRSSLLAAAGLLYLSSVVAHAAPLLAPGDPIFAYDLDTAGGSTGGATYFLVDYPGAESPAKAIDGINSDSSKYLNRAKHNAGIIVTASSAAAAKSMVLTTGGDAQERDPKSYIILGSNQPITSADKSNGFADHWTYIAQGTLSLPATRKTVAAPINFPNTVAYSSYWIVFPTTKDTAANNLMQITEIQLYTGTGGTGSAIFAPGNPALCTGWNSSIASGEIVSRVIDGNAGTKYLNFGENNSGFYVVPSTGPTIINSFQLTTANDSSERDPATWQIHGMAPNGVWSLIDSGSVSLPTKRGALGPLVTVSNTLPFLAYRMTFPTVRDAAVANSMQVAEAQFYGTIFPRIDSDNDGMDDDWEVRYGLVVGVNDSAGDLDSDGSKNLEEYQRATNPLVKDSDGDGLEDGVESDTGIFVDATNTGTDPLRADTDADGYSDSYEIAKNTDPNDVNDAPTLYWDIAPGVAGVGDDMITGGTGTWDHLTTANWTVVGGYDNVTWNNAGSRLSAIFGGVGGTVTLAGPVIADRVIVDTDGYIFAGDALTLASSTPQISVATGTCEMSQVIAGTNGFIKRGNGILRLTGSSNTYTGTTILKDIGKIVLAKNPGAIAIAGNILLDSFAFTPNNSGLVLAGDEQIADTSIISWANVGQADSYFRLNGHIETIGGLVSDGVGSFVVVENRGSGDVTPYNQGELLIQTVGSNSYGYNGRIRDNDGGIAGASKIAITKLGTGTQILSGELVYTGPTSIEAGTLQIDSNLASSFVTVFDTGTVAGTGSLPAGVNVNTGGFIAPGGSDVGTLASGNANIAGTYQCQIDGATADRITVSGNLTLSGGSLKVETLAAPTANFYVIASYSGALTDTFSVTGAPLGYEVLYLTAAKQILLAKNNYATWAYSNGLSGNAASDYDLDGLADAVEYVLGTNPKTSNANGPTGAVVGANFVFSFTRSHASETQGLEVAIEVSTDLNVWPDVYNVGGDTNSSSSGVEVTDNGSSDTITLTIPRVGHAQKFARLRVTAAP